MSRAALDRNGVGNYEYGLVLGAEGRIGVGGESRISKINEHPSIHHFIHERVV